MKNRSITFYILSIITTGVFYSCTTSIPDNNWHIKQKGNSININAGILEQNIVISDTDFSTTLMSVSGENMLKSSSSEIGFSIHKASPNQQPVGIGYSSNSGIEQSNAEANQTDALSVKKAKGGTSTNVQWVDSVYISGKNFSNVFEYSGYNVSYPQEEVQRLTLSYKSNIILQGFSFDVNYEIYTGDPVIRKWIKFDNQGREWIKISDLMMYQSQFSKAYSRRTNKLIIKKLHRLTRPIEGFLRIGLNIISFIL